jgi:hypothetical protein
MAQRTYTRTYKCSEQFPVDVDDAWHVKQGTKVAEAWRVLTRTRLSFTVEITEYFRV